MLQETRTKSYFLNQIFWSSPWQRPFRICTALLMGDRPTGTQSWRLSQSELVIQHHSPPISVSLSYYLLLTLYSEKQKHLKTTCRSKISLLSSSSLCLTQWNSHSLNLPDLLSWSHSSLPPVTTHPPAVGHQTLPADFSFSSYSCSPHPCNHRGPTPSSEPLLQALQDGCTGLARKCIQVLTNPRRRGREPGEQTREDPSFAPAGALCHPGLSTWRIWSFVKREYLS